MTKFLLETSGDFGLLNSNGDWISSTRPSVTVDTTFVHGRTALGQLKVLAKLKDEATDELFLEYVLEYTVPAKGKTPASVNMAAAVDSFLSKYGAEQATSKGTPPAAE